MPAPRVPFGELKSFPRRGQDDDLATATGQWTEHQRTKEELGGLVNEGFSADIEDEEAERDYVGAVSVEQIGTADAVPDEEFSQVETTFNRSNTYTVNRERRRERMSDLRDPRELVDSGYLKDHRALPFPRCRDPNCPHQKERGLPAPPVFPQGFSAPWQHPFHSSFFSSSFYGGPSPYSWHSSSPSSLPLKLPQSSSSPSTLPIKTSRSHSPSLPPSYPVVTLPRSQRRASSLVNIRTSFSTRKTSIVGKVSSLFRSWGCSKDKQSPGSFQMTLPPSRSDTSCTSSCSCSTCSCSSCSSSLHLQMPPQPQTYPRQREKERYWYRCDLTCFIVSALVALSFAGIAALVLYLHLFSWPIVQA